MLSPKLGCWAFGGHPWGVTSLLGPCLAQCGGSPGPWDPRTALTGSASFCAPQSSKAQAHARNKLQSGFTQRHQDRGHLGSQLHSAHQAPSDSGQLCPKSAPILSLGCRPTLNTPLLFSKFCQRPQPPPGSCIAWRSTGYSSSTDLSNSLFGFVLLLLEPLLQILGPLCLVHDVLTHLQGQDAREKDHLPGLC